MHTCFSDQCINRCHRFYVVDRTAPGAFHQSGQSCVGAERILIRFDIYDALLEWLSAKPAPSQRDRNRQ